MKYIRKFSLLVALGLLTISCSTKASSNCCQGIPSSTTIHSNEPMFETDKTINAHIDPCLRKEGKEEFDPDRVEIVDKIGQNILVRGNLPIKNGKFAYADLKKAINEQLDKTSRRRVNPDFLLIDISLLPLGQFSIEQKWFRDNPRFGCFWNRPVVGSLTDPTKMSRKERIAYLKHSDMASLNEFIDKIHALVSANCGRPTVVYIHCHCGKNRTGEIIACYKMKYMGESYKDVVKENTKKTGKIHEASQNAIQMYAFYLRDKLKEKGVGKIEGK